MSNRGAHARSDTGNNDPNQSETKQKSDCLPVTNSPSFQIYSLGAPKLQSLNKSKVNCPVPKIHELEEMHVFKFMGYMIFMLIGRLGKEG